MKTHPLPPTLRLAALLALLPAAAHAAAPVNLVANADMADGESLPLAWDQSWTGSGRLDASRDPDTYNSAPAALRVSTGGAPAEGQRSQIIPVTAGSRLAVEGWLRSRGELNAVFGIQFFAGWQPLKFEEIRLLRGTEDWTRGQRVLEVPAGATRAGVQLYVNGTGEAWLDDVVIAPEGAAGSTAASSSSPAATPGGERTVLLLADFAQQPFDYGYGAWENLAAVVAPATDSGRVIAAESGGGAGRVLKPATPAAGATHLRLVGRVLARNTAEHVVVVLKGPRDQDIARVLVPLARLSRGELGELAVALPAALGPSAIEQLQVQGAYRPDEYLHLELAALALVALSPSAVR